MLRCWDGRVDSDSPGAAVFELFLGELIQAVVRAKAPKAADWALGKSFIELEPHSNLAFKRVGFVVRLLKSTPADWFEQGWERATSEALDRAMVFLKQRFGAKPEEWRWGRVRRIELIHMLGEAPVLKNIFNLGPYEHRGDTNTISSGPVPPDDPTGNPMACANMRMVVEVGNWSNNRWVLAGGVSGNPLSPHYDDMIPMWLAGQGTRMAWSPEEVLEKARTTLHLVP
jgi:penicillin amidase